MTALVGVDAGGSHTEAAAASQATDILARLQGEPAAVDPERIDAAATVIAALVRDVLTGAGLPVAGARVTVGAAGAGRPRERTALQSALRVALATAAHIGVTTDAEIALEDAFPAGTPGLVLVAGTGSVAFARDAAGHVWRAGGLGWQLGDEGSGYALGRAALGAVGRAADGRGRETTLTGAIHDETGTATLDELIQWGAAADRRGVARLAPAVFRMATAGDAVAAQLVSQAATELAQHVEALASRFDTDHGVPVAFAGGLLSQTSPMWTATRMAIAERVPRATIAEAPVDAVRGALRLAAGS